MPILVDPQTNWEEVRNRQQKEILRLKAQLSRKDQAGELDRPSNKLLAQDFEKRVEKLNLGERRGEAREEFYQACLDMCRHLFAFHHKAAEVQACLDKFNEAKGQMTELAWYYGIGLVDRKAGLTETLTFPGHFFDWRGGSSAVRDNATGLLERLYQRVQITGPPGPDASNKEIIDWLRWERLEKAKQMAADDAKKSPSITTHTKVPEPHGITWFTDDHP